MVIIAPAAPLLGSPTGDLALRIRGTSRSGQIIRLSSAKCTVGSDRNCTLRLRAPGVKAFHCLILRGSHQTIVRRWSPDTRLNGFTFEDAALQPGDRLSIAGIELEVLAGVAAPAKAPVETMADVRQTAQDATVQSNREQIRAVSRQGRRRTARMIERIRQLTARLAESETSGAEAETLRLQLHESQESTQQELAARAKGLDELAARLEAERRELEHSHELSLQRDAEGRKGWEAERAELDRRSADVDRQQAELHRRQIELDAKQADLDAQRTTHEQTAREAKDSIAADQSRLDEALNNLTARQLELQHQHTEWEGERSRLANEAAALRNNLQALQQAAASHVEHDPAPMQELAERQLELSGRELQITEERSRLEAWRTELDARQGELNASHAELHERRQAIETEQATLRQQQAQFQASQSDAAEKLSAERTSFDSQRSAWEAEQQRGQDQLQQQHDTLAATQSDLDLRRRTLDAMQQAFEAEQAAFSAQRQSVESQDNSLAAERQSLAAQMAELEQQRQTVAAQAAELAAQKTALDEANAQIAQLEALRAELATQQATLEAEARSLRSAQEDQHQRVTEENARFAERAAELDALQRSLDARSEVLQGLQARSEQLDTLRQEFERDREAWIAQREAEQADIAARSEELTLDAERLTEQRRRLDDDLQAAASQSVRTAPELLNDDVREDGQSAAPAADENDVFARLRGLSILKSDAPASTAAARTADDSTDEAEEVQPEPKPIAAPPSSRAAANALGSEEEPEESIDAYMARLLNRMRGGEPEPAPTRSRPKREAPVEPAAPVAVMKEPIVEAPVVKHEPLVMIPRKLPPELSSNLQAMRDLANFQARGAIETNAHRRWLRAAIGKFSVAACGLIASIILVTCAEDWHSTIFLAGMAGMLVAVFWGLQGAILSKHVWIVMRRATKERVASMPSRVEKYTAPQDREIVLDAEPAEAPTPEGVRDIEESVKE